MVTARGLAGSRTTTRRRSSGRPARAGEAVGVFEEQLGDAAADGAAAEQGDAEWFSHESQAVQGREGRCFICKAGGTGTPATDPACHAAAASRASW